MERFKACHEFNNCDELLGYLYVAKWNSVECSREVMFQDEPCEIGYFMPDVHNSVYAVSPKYKQVVFVVEEAEDGKFLLAIYMGVGIFDQTLGIILPAYVRDELIETAGGNW